MRCSVYANRDYHSRCENRATRWLIGPTGKRNPGGFVCENHAQEILSEYREKLGENWGSQSIDDLGNLAVLLETR